METITFYSYKGDVGRTLALANIAIYLSRFRQNVCLLDFDIEAPGLLYKFAERLKPSDIKKGLVDYIDDYIQSRYKILPELTDDYFHEIVPASESQGSIHLIPAGNVLSAEYWRKLAAINWHDLFYNENDPPGIPFFSELKKKINDKINPAFLLIDSRTGVTETSGICTALLPDKVVFLSVHNQENIEGTRQIMRSVQQANIQEKPIELYLVICRIPLQRKNQNEKPIPSPRKNRNEDQIERDIKDNIKFFFNPEKTGLTNIINYNDINILHSDRELELAEYLVIDQEGVTSQTPLLRDYLKLFSKVISDSVVSDKLESIIDEIMNKDNLLDQAEEAQKDLENLVVSLSSFYYL